MRPPAVVRAIHLFEDRGAGLCSAGKGLPGTSGFQRGKETFHHGIVMVVGNPPHAFFDPVGGQAGSVLGAGVLAALIRMMQQAGGDKVSLRPTVAESLSGQRPSILMQI